MRINVFLVFLAIAIASCSNSESPTAIEIESPSTSDETNEFQNSKYFAIDSIYPKMADLGDTLNLKGNNLKKEIQILLGRTQLQVFFNNDSLLKFIVPYSGFEPDSVHLKINNHDSVINYKNAFKLYIPEIDSIPSNFGFMGSVVVYGKHLTNNPETKDGIIELNNEGIRVISHDKNSIRFLLPYNISKHENDLVVTAQLRRILKQKSVIIPNPKLSGISKDSVSIGEEITIYGSNFYPGVTNYNEVYIDGKRTEVIEAYSDSLIVKIPLGPYSGRNVGNIKVKVLDKEVINGFEMFLKSKWYLYGYKRSNELSRRGGAGQISRQSFYFNNSMYFNVSDDVDGVPNSASTNYRLYKYTPESNIWEQQADLPVFIDVTKGESIQIFPANNGDIYIYIDRAIDNFYKYNLNSKSLLKLLDFNASYQLGDAIGFIFNNNFYIGAGYGKEYSYSSSIFINNKFWKYTPDSNAWNEISEIPEVQGQYEYGYYSNYFKQDNSIYICNGERSYATWEFSPDDTWVRKADMESPVSQTVFTQIGDKGFYYDYNEKLFWEYDLTNNNWSKREKLKVDEYNLEKETIFVHEGYVYLVGWQNGYPPNYTDFFNLDHIILRTELSNFID